MPPFTSPFPTTSSKPGHGSVVLSLLPPATPVFTTLSYTYPLKLLPSTPHTIPRPQPAPPAKQPVNHDTETEDAAHGITGTTSSHTNNAATPPSPPTPSQSSLLFLLTYGGGLLAGDAIHLTLTLNPGTRLVVTTQGMGKIFPPPSAPPITTPPSPSSSFPAAAALAPSPSHLPQVPSAAARSPPPPASPSAQHIHTTLHPSSSLWLCPDATQPFNDSRYESHQRFYVDRTASLGVLEWVNRGRAARGEEWGFRGWRSGIDVWEMREGGEGEGERGRGRLVVRDVVVLENSKHDEGEVKGRMDGYGVVGTLILMGPVFESLADFFVGEFEGLERIGGRDWGGGDGRDDNGAGVEGGGEDEERRRRERWRAGRQRMEREQGVVWTGCHVRGGKCCVVKFMAREMQGARDWLGGMLREEGTVGREFGEGGLMFVR